MLAVLFLLSCLAPATATAAAQTAPLDGEREKISYLVGSEIGQSLRPAVADLDLAALRRALEHGLAAGEPLLDAEKVQATRIALSRRMQARAAGSVADAPAVSAQDVGLMVGGDLARSLKPQAEQIELDALMRGVQDVLQQRPSQLSAEETAAVRQRLVERQQQQARDAAERNAAEGERFLAANRGEKGVVSTRSGLQYLVLRPGKGARPLPTSQVRVDYEGRLLDGTVFDSSYARGEPAEFALNRVIAGWTEGLGLMAPGAKYRFWIPSGLGYGTRGSPPNIGPNQTLVFDVELHDILN
ncbi:FKBP-type peptidyl-prolyl cis-trans isomerase N-terminal domain-containing protein [Luteimonas sp. e5]